MKKNIIFATLAVVAMSCQKEAINTNLDSQTKAITVDAVMDQSAESRVSTDSEWKTAWESGDALISGQTNAANLCAVEPFTMTSCSGKLAAFSGEVTSDAANPYSVRFLYGGTATIFNGTVEFTVDVASQDGTLNKTSLISEKLLTETELTAEPAAKFAMKHLGAVMTLKIAIENFANGYTLTKLKYCNVPTAVEFKYNKAYTDALIDAWHPAKTTGDITVDLASPIAITSEGASVNLNIIPFEMAANGSNDIELTFQKEDGTIVNKTITKANPTSGILKFDRATYNSLKITCDMSDMPAAVVGSEFADMTFFQTEFGEGGNKTLPDSDTWLINVTDIPQGGDAFIAKAVEYAESLGRTIELHFPNIATVHSMTHLASVSEFLSFPAATSIDMYAFQNSTMLKELHLPMIQEIGMASLSGCNNLTTLELATAKGAKITKIHSPMFSDQSGTILPNVDLTIGGYDPSLISIDGNKLTITNKDNNGVVGKEVVYEYNFKSITEK